MKSAEGKERVRRQTGKTGMVTQRRGKQETGEGVVETQCASTQVCKSVNVQCGECRTVAV